jgi:hypothetical protein
LGEVLELALSIRGCHSLAFELSKAAL